MIVKASAKVVRIMGPLVATEPFIQLPAPSGRAPPVVPVVLDGEDLFAAVVSEPMPVVSPVPDLVHPVARPMATSAGFGQAAAGDQMVFDPDCGGGQTPDAPLVSGDWPEARALRGDGRATPVTEDKVMKDRSGEADRSCSVVSDAGGAIPMQPNVAASCSPLSFGAIQERYGTRLLADQEPPHLRAPPALAAAEVSAVPPPLTMAALEPVPESRLTDPVAVQPAIPKVFAAAPTVQAESLPMFVPAVREPLPQVNLGALVDAESHTSAYRLPEPKLAEQPDLPQPTNRPGLDVPASTRPVTDVRETPGQDCPVPASAGPPSSTGGLALPERSLAAPVSVVTPRPSAIPPLPDSSGMMPSPLQEIPSDAPPMPQDPKVIALDSAALARPLQEAPVWIKVALPHVDPVEAALADFGILIPFRDAGGYAPTLPASVFAAPAAQGGAFELARSISQQVSVAAAGAADRPVEVLLAPEELGRVRLTLNASDTGITVSVVAERPETLDLMRRNIDTLARDFRELGYDNIAFSFGASSERGQGGLDHGLPGQFAASSHPDDEVAEPITELLSSKPRPSPDEGLDLRM